MLFSSIVFLVYFLPMVLVFYYATFWSRKMQNVLLFIMSLVFYAWGEPSFVFLMLGMVGFLYVMGLIMDRYPKKILLVITLAGNLSVLVWYKYFNFIVENLNQTLGEQYQIPMHHVTMPIGISFFTFQAMSYAIDVYHKRVKVQKNPLYLGLYIAFFPQLVAGPIVRYSDMEEQILGRKESMEKFSAGWCRFLVGLSKKILLSNSLAVIADRIFTMQEYHSIPVILAWLGAIAYTLQILYDFAGYSDMAIGLALVFGFKFEENFNYPYTSKSISEFWRRWHISLGAWFREYVYIPLGGSRVENKDKMVRNLLVVWILTGIWHGANWTFLLWGLFNFIFIFFEKFMEFERLDIPSPIKHIYSMMAVMIGWVLFRSNDLIQAGRYIANLFGFGADGFFSDYAWMFVKENFLVLVAAIVFTMPVARTVNQHLYEQKRGYRVLEFCYPATMFLLVLLCLSCLVKGTYNPFIYFNF